MRPGLVVIGVAFLAVAAVSATSLFLWPNTPSTRTVTTEVPSTASGPNETREALLVGTNSTSGTFTLDWQSTGPFRVVLYDVPGCASAASACARGSPLASWPGNLSGHFRADGPLAFPYLLVWTDRSGSVGSLQATAESVAEVTTPAPVWATLATVGALGSLGAVGVVAFFLGVFLRSGVYRRPGAADASRRPAVERERIPSDGPTGPKTGFPADGAGPPRPGPPSPGP
ncbi:MAG: hypothetical protein L3J95_03160 [Thermoplasmata archaeon]|nr:hypothetical protein [Thermoplasmata archaeon]MCI4359406.1 hypothetical protein [Thermoplasmata archaeon]